MIYLWKCNPYYLPDAVRELTEISKNGYEIRYTWAFGAVLRSSTSKNKSFSMTVKPHSKTSLKYVGCWFVEQQVGKGFPSQEEQMAALRKEYDRFSWKCVYGLLLICLAVMVVVFSQKGHTNWVYAAIMLTCGLLYISQCVASMFQIKNAVSRIEQGSRKDHLKDTVNTAKGVISQLLGHENVTAACRAMSLPMDAHHQPKRLLPGRFSSCRKTRHQKKMERMSIGTVPADNNDEGHTEDEIPKKQQ